ncbi:MAG: urea carboxylase [Chthoniobacteraceae bacterium]
MFQKVLIANRGEIACRVLRTLRKLGITSVAVYSEADADARHVTLADEAVCIGPAPARESYLDSARILMVAAATGAQAIHPGYGFLSENADFAEACEGAGIAFIGPTPDQIRRFGLKHTSREIARECGVPLLPGTDLLSSADEAVAAAEKIGWPVMIKSTAGGGGIGMQLCANAGELREKFETVRNLGRANFKNDGLYLEKFVETARHVEVQIFGDGKGHIAVLGERDCSTQRRNQKVIEETPAPGLTEELRHELWECAKRLGEKIAYRSAGTVEFVFDVKAGQFYFLEVNTRLQVEHGVTEEVTGTDLVEWMLRIAAGEPLPAVTNPPGGHSIQARIYAEDPAKNYQPSCGLLTEVRFPEGVRADAWVDTGTIVSPYYDPLLAKLIVHAPTRPAALVALDQALAQTRIEGIETNRDYLRQVAACEAFRSGAVPTAFLKTFPYHPRTVEVLASGTITTVQDYPGRLGLWTQGVPPSGPFDSLSFRLANRVLDNPEGAPGLEMTLSGPTLLFRTAACICLAGASMRAQIDGNPVPYWQPVNVAAGQTLRLGFIEGQGAHTYLAVKGGFDVPEYLGSRSTFRLGKFGGHGGRALQTGDVLKLLTPGATVCDPKPLDPALIPSLPNEWEISVLYGPHGAPDYFTREDIAMIFATAWKVHFNSDRTGVRLIGPKPKWARKDGGEAGLHPSNIHDNAYAVGAIDFTGDMPILLGPDGPSLGGFVCPACIIQSDLWKMGQLKAGDTVRFRAVGAREALTSLQRQDESLAKLIPLPAPAFLPMEIPEDAALVRLPETEQRPAVVYRPAGDNYLLVEYGAPVLDLPLRFRAQALMDWTEAQHIEGIIDLTPGIRSLQIHFDSRRCSREVLLGRLIYAESVLPSVEAMEVPTRIVHLPLSWADPATQVAIDKYTASVRPDAPWCPSNIEFIRRINGLDSIEQVKDIVFGASYLVLGLGDVYLGAPVAVPLDPRHRLVTTKYNPARTWTPENAVGIGGAYLCVYGMEGPGGYQFVGRTVQMWNRWRSTANFEPGKPWLLRFFDQIRFYPVSPEELLRLRQDFLQGRFQVKVEETTFKLRDYLSFLNSISKETTEFTAAREDSFGAERERWRVAGLDKVRDEVEIVAETAQAFKLPPGTVAAEAPMTANVWQVTVKPGDHVSAGDKVVVLEAMKMEIAVTAPCDGVIHSVVCETGKQVAPGQPLCCIEAC